MTDKSDAPFVGVHAEELKARLNVQAQMLDAINKLDFSDKDHWSVQLTQSGDHVGCWVVAEQSMMPAVAATLVGVLARVIQMADEHGPEIGMATRIASLSAFNDINIQGESDEGSNRKVSH